LLPFRRATPIVIKDDDLQVPMSHAFKRAHPDLERIRISFPARLEGKTIKEVRILPRDRARLFSVQFVYEAAPEPSAALTDAALTMDLGLDNLATCVNRADGSSFIIDGKSLKSINHQYNVRTTKLQALLDRQKLPRSERMARITMTRNHRVYDTMMKVARYLINYCLANRIGTIIVGYHPDWKRDIHLGKRNHQNFMQIPHGQLRAQLESLCDRYGIRYVEQEESCGRKRVFWIVTPCRDGMGRINPSQFQASG